MIVSFSVSNFRSFKSEQTLSLVASRRQASAHAEHTIPIPDSNERVLRCAVLYGANGAGKSNLFKALRKLKELALSVRPKSAGIARSTFQLSSDSVGDTIFDIQFISDRKLYRYGISVDDQQIKEEWLIRVISNKEIVLYERKQTENGPKISARSALKAGDKLRALRKIVGPSNQSFLATARATLDKDDLGSELSAVVRWFSKTLHTIAPDETYGALSHALSADPTFLEFAGSFLRNASTGVDRLRAVKREITEEELRKTIPEEVVSEILSAELEDEDIGLTLLRNEDGQEFLIDRKGEKQFHQLSISSEHQDAKGGFVAFPLEDESDGTRRLLDFAPTLHKGLVGGGTTYFIDEIDRSLHPLLVRGFIELFLKNCVEVEGQIIVTTHESHLLDLELLRRDEIWFAEKDRENATRLHSLSQYKVRNDLEIRKHYFQGRFGAIPFLGDFRSLSDPEESCLDATEAAPAK